MDAVEGSLPLYCCVGPVMNRGGGITAPHNEVSSPALILRWAFPWPPPQQQTTQYIQLAGATMFFI